jgi:hypothetical protein
LAEESFCRLPAEDCRRFTEVLGWSISVKKSPAQAGFTDGSVNRMQPVLNGD